MNIFYNVYICTDERVFVALCALSCHVALSYSLAGKSDNSVLYLSLRTITAIFCAIGVALWSTVGVVVSNPPNDSK